MTWLLVLLVCSSAPTMGYDGCARWSVGMPDERSCHHAGRRWVRTGQAERYECSPAPPSPPAERPA